jgi:hypothetical protein
MAPATSSQRKCRLPCFEIPPSLSLPPVECCLVGDWKEFRSGRSLAAWIGLVTSATSAVATIGPTPGISSSRRLSSHERCQAWIRFSMATISSLTAAYWRARTSRLNRAAAGMRSSCSSAMARADPLRKATDHLHALARRAARWAFRHYLAPEGGFQSQSRRMRWRASLRSSRPATILRSRIEGKNSKRFFEIPQQNQRPVY